MAKKFLFDRIAFIGIGLRSNFEACQQLMDQDLLGTRRFAVVRDDQTGEILFSKNAGVTVPIASISKTFTAAAILRPFAPVLEGAHVSPHLNPPTTSGTTAGLRSRHREGGLPG